MLSRAVVFRLIACGHFAERVSDVGLAGRMDFLIWREAFKRDATTITANVEDFLYLARKSEIHAGLIVLHLGRLRRDDQVAWVEAALRWLDRHRLDMMNRVIEVSGETDANVSSYLLPMMV
jgi:predicted nuclease of predicted toxin-antitoxin system